METIQLPTKAEFVTRALAALEAGELQCQRPDFKLGDQCLYQGPCVVGAVMAPEERLFADEANLDDGTIGSLMDSEIVLLPEDGSIDPNWLITLQGHHDTANVEAMRKVLTE